MIKYIILIICIIIIGYLLFRYKKEGFDPLNSTITISDISKNLLIDHSYNFIDTSLNVIHSKRYYPSDLLDINDIVDGIVVKDISYNNSQNKLAIATSTRDNSLKKRDDFLRQMNTNIDNFDNGLRKSINNRISTTIISYDWTPSPTNTKIPTQKYTTFKSKFDRLILLRNSKLVSEVYSRTSNFYSNNKNSKLSIKDNSFKVLKNIRQKIYNIGYITIDISATSITKDQTLLSTLLNSTADTSITIQSNFKTKYDNAIPIGTNIQNIKNITFIFNDLNLPDISGSLTNQFNRINGLLEYSFRTFQSHMNNLNNYVTNYAINLQKINGYNDTSMLSKIIAINTSVDNYYLSSELRSSFDLTKFKINNENDVILSYSKIDDYTDPQLNSKIIYSKNTSYAYATDKNKYRVMADALYGINVDTNGEFDRLYTKIEDDNKNNVYLQNIKALVDEVNRDILNSNSLIASINVVLRQSCVNKTLNTNPSSKNIINTSNDLNYYLNNSSINNISYYGTYSRTNTNISCNTEVDNQPIITTSVNITMLKNYITNVKNAIDFYNRRTIYNSILSEYNKYTLIKPRLESMSQVKLAYKTFITKNSINFIYRDLITSYSNTVDARTYYNTTFRPSIIKRYAINVYKVTVDDYNTKNIDYINANNLNNIKIVFDFIYDEFEKKALISITSSYKNFIKWRNINISDQAEYERKIQEKQNALTNLKNNNTQLHSRVSDAIQGIMDDTDKYNKQVIEKTINDKTDEMMNNLNEYTKSIAESKKDAFNYITSTNDLLAKQQAQFNGGNGPDAQLNEYIENNNNPFVSSDSLRSGKIDRYKDTECKEGEFIYCLGGQIECVDIYGDKIEDTMVDMSDTYKSYTRGKTYGKCGSYIKKINIGEYSNQMSENLIQEGNIGYFYDLTKCTQEKPWRVGGEGTPISFNACYSDPDKASGMYAILRKMNPTDFLNKSLVYIESEYIVQDYTRRFPDTLKFLNNTTAKWIGNQRMYQGIIKSMNKNNLFDIYVPDETGILLSDIEPKRLRLPNLNMKDNPKLDNLPKGSHPRPLCRYGKFSNKCSKGDDPPIDFKSKDVASKDLELNKYLLTPKYGDTKYITGSNTLDDLYTPGTTIANTNNVLGFSVYE